MQFLEASNLCYIAIPYAQVSHTHTHTHTHTPYAHRHTFWIGSLAILLRCKEERVGLSTRDESYHVISHAVHVERKVGVVRSKLF